MNLRRTLLLMGMLIMPAMGRAHATDLCPVWIGIGPHGALFELSPRGLPPVKADMASLRNRLLNGCQADRLTPSRVTSVTVKVAPHALRGTTSTVFSLLAQQGWPRNRVQQQAWSSWPR